MAACAGHHRNLLQWFRLKHLRRGSTAAACVALLLQLFIPLFHVPPVWAADSGVPQWATLAICHVDVAAPQPLADNGHQHGNQTPRAHPVCPICLGLHIAGTYTQPPFIVLPYPIRSAAIGFPDHLQENRSGAADSRARARAPPFAG